MEESKAVLSKPKYECDCDCDGCDIGHHCGRKNVCCHPRWSDVAPEIRKQESDLDYLEKPENS
jgi:hypothetical protein